MKLHLGCGKRNFPGFINVDLADFPHIHHRCSVDDLSMFEDNSGDLIYASHVLEYFPLNKVPEVLKEWRRVLRPGGILKLAVPDFKNLARAYLKYGNVLSVQGPIYGFFEITSNGIKRELNHKVIYDFKLLKKVLEENGFKDVKRYDWIGFVPEGCEDHSMAYLPTKDYNGILVSLNIQALKAGEINKKFLEMKNEIISFKDKAKNKMSKWLR